MIKFEEHDGKLFLMLEEPVPLTDKTNLPVLVQLIQDDTMLGKANKRSCRTETLAQKIICTKLTDGGLYLTGNYTYRYEIIGTPVAEGSKDWALYQMMSGKKVCHKKFPSIIYCKHASKIMREARCGCVDYMSIDAWLNGAHKNGWQIYTEPKPESQYKGYGIKDLKPDNIYLNIKPSNPADWCFDKKNLLFLVDDNFKGIVGENVTREQVVEIVKLLTEPAPQYKVWDWVEFIDAGGRKSQGKYLSKAYDNAILIRDITYNTRCVVPTTKIIRKLSPADIVIHIGCRSGTVEKSSLFNKIGFILVTEAGNCWISFDAIDKETREIVESLLKAQEEECKP